MRQQRIVGRSAGQFVAPALLGINVERTSIDIQQSSPNVVRVRRQLQHPLIQWRGGLQPIKVEVQNLGELERGIQIIGLRGQTVLQIPHPLFDGTTVFGQQGRRRPIRIQGRSYWLPGGQSKCCCLGKIGVLLHNRPTLFW